MNIINIWFFKQRSLNNWALKFTFIIEIETFCDYMLFWFFVSILDGASNDDIIPSSEEPRSDSVQIDGEKETAGEDESQNEEPQNVTEDSINEGANEVKAEDNMIDEDPPQENEDQVAAGDDIGKHMTLNIAKICHK